MHRIVQASTPEEFDAARALFREYAAQLQAPICFEGFESELREIERLYAPPRGALLLLVGDAGPCGCVAIRPLGDGCEMKRLYVTAGARGQGYGRALASAIEARAAASGYPRLYLETLPSMIEAAPLYASMGFREVRDYPGGVQPGVRYLAKEIVPPPTI